ncbi:MAG: hypothetical protein U0271_25795 [Polyangiaceae bacterium]
MVASGRGPAERIHEQGSGRLQLGDEVLTRSERAITPAPSAGLSTEPVELESSSSLAADAAEWARGRSPWVRGVLLAYLAYAFARHLLDPLYRSWFAGLTLVLHEGGHLMFMFFGRTLMFLGGSIVQIAAPLAAGIYLVVRQRDWFGGVVGASWLSYSTFELATYVDDANRGELPLVGMGDNVEHDWETLLTQWHVLNQAQLFATLLRVCAASIGFLGLVLGVWLLAEMWRTRATRPAHARLTR